MLLFLTTKIQICKMFHMRRMYFEHMNIYSGISLVMDHKKVTSSLDRRHPVVLSYNMIIHKTVKTTIFIIKTNILQEKRYCLYNKYSYVDCFNWGTRWRSWLRHYATNRNVAGSIPDGVIGINSLT
jgi:hypothetical protein